MFEIVFGAPGTDVGSTRVGVSGSVGFVGKGGGDIVVVFFLFVGSIVIDGRCVGIHF